MGAVQGVGCTEGIKYSVDSWPARAGQDLFVHILAETLANSKDAILLEYYCERWLWPLNIINGSNGQLYELTPRIIETHSRFPGCAFFGRFLASKLVTTLAVVITPILKSSFVKVVDILLCNSILCNCILYKSKPLSNYNWIFALYSFIIVLAAEFAFELWTAVNEICSPILANDRFALYGKKKIGHFLYILYPARPGGGIFYVNLDRGYIEQ